MKRLLILILLLFLVFTLPAQQIAVKSFRSLFNDLDARTSYPVEDKNGEKAALIKIVTNETGFEFDAGVIGIVATVQKTGEIWLYIPHGSKAVTIKHSKFTLLRNYAYPQSIEAGEVYEMVLTTGRLVTTIEEQIIETQWLIITTDPAGADVYINDQPAGKTPYQNNLPIGNYTWRVSKELYLSEVGIAELTSSGEKQVMTVKMKPDFGTLNITSLPENGSKVSLNGIETGKTTPCSIEKVPSGIHSISLSLNEYETTTQRLTLAAGETKKVDIIMQPTFAQVTVSTEPASDIYINGQMKINGNWQGRLNPGVYTFEAKLDKHITASEMQTVIVGKPLNIKLTPTPRTGTLKIITTPFDAVIKIGGKEMGKSPVLLRNQLIGDYNVELSLPGYATMCEKTTITEGQTTEINTTLQNGTQVAITSTPVGAALFIDDKPAGKTPYSGSLGFGSHTLRIENNGKKTEKEVHLSQGGAAFFTLTISSNLSDFTETASGLNLEMILVQGGTFNMGSDNGETNEKPVHAVTLSDFMIGKYEVTQKQWRLVTGKDPSSFKNCDNCPVEQVSRDDIQDFIQKLNQKTGRNYRLPTEAEWEYAARGGNQSKGYTYSGSNSLADVAWFADNSGSKTHPVGQKQANESGLYDMSGNVWEWCSDWYGNYSPGPQTNPKGPSRGSDRVNRGGSWLSSAKRCRSTGRDYDYPDRRSYLLGFRLVIVP
jgi:formylglycine-generating enzyme required for sulfatase activity